MKGIKNMTRKEFLSEIIAPVFLSDTSYLYSSDEKSRFFIDLVFKDFKLFKHTFFDGMKNMFDDGYTYEVLEHTHNLSEEQVRDYLTPSKIERDYLRTLWKHCKKRRAEFKIARGL